MINWIRNKYHRHKHGHKWEFIKGVPDFTAFIIGNTYCKRCGKTMYNDTEG